MIDDKKIHQLEKAFERVFAFNISRSTFRQVQNVIFAITEGNREMATIILEGLINGEIKPEAASQVKGDQFKKFIQTYAVRVQVAKDVLERGEFINLVTSDILQNPQAIVFANRIRRIDGDELQFITDTESTLQLVSHFISRIQELHRAEPARNILNGHQKDLDAIKTRIEELLVSVK